MLQLVPFLFPLLIFAIVIPLVIWGVVVTRRRTEENLRKVAAQLGLDFFPAVGWTASPRVAGRLRGKTVELYSYSTGGGKSRVNWGAVTVQATPGGAFAFTLQRQGVGTKIMGLFGAREITLGDPRFDDAWFVQTNRPEFLAAALLPELREKLMAAQAAGPSGKFELNDGLVKYSEQGTLANPRLVARLAAVADLVGDLAEVAEVGATDLGPP